MSAEGFLFIFFSRPTCDVDGALIRTRGLYAFYDGETGANEIKGIISTQNFFPCETNFPLSPVPGEGGGVEPPVVLVVVVVVVDEVGGGGAAVVVATPGWHLWICVLDWNEVEKWLLKSTN